MLTTRLKSVPRHRGGRTTDAAYERYEAYKAEWLATHPGATPEQYAAAMTAIAKRCGV